MPLPPRAAMSSDNLLCNSQKEQRKTNMADGNKTPALLQLLGALPSGLTNNEMDVGFLEKGAAYISRNPPYLKAGLFVPLPQLLAISKLSILFQEVW